MAAPPRILIVGAGLGGLSRAIALRNQGIHAQIIERTDQWTTAGAGIYLIGYAMRARDTLGLADQVRKAGAYVPTQTIFSGARNLPEHGVGCGDGVRRFHRSRAFDRIRPQSGGRPSGVCRGASAPNALGAIPNASARSAAPLPTLAGGSAHTFILQTRLCIEL